MNLLALDDDQEIGAIIVAVATKLGWSAASTCTAEDFRKRVGENRPDAIVLDLHLGASDGIEQLRFLKDLQWTGPILLISGFDNRILAAAQNIGKSLNLTIAGVLHKPMRAAVLTEALRAMGDRYGRIAAARIQAALAEGEMWLDFQPVVDARTSAVHHLEALIRWRHPARGIVPPIAFIPVAEQDEALMNRLTSWVIQTALAQYQTLRDRGAAIPIAVNVSGSNLRDLDFPDQIELLLQAAGVPPSALLLEVTESVATSDPAAMLDILTRLRLKDIDVAIDDFGTGYSTLVALHRLPFTELKIDASFVTDIFVSQESLAIVRSVIDLSRNLGLRSVAEGVENEAVAAELRNLGVDLMQGYYFSKPLPPSQLETWLMERQHRHAVPRLLMK